MRRTLIAMFVCLGAISGRPAFAQKIAPQHYYIYCTSQASGAYTSTGRGMGWRAFVKIEDVRTLGISGDKLQDYVETRFGAWVRATNQYGRWNSLQAIKIDCGPQDRDAFKRIPAFTAARGDRDWSDANLPSDWYKRLPSAPSEIARYSTGKPPPGVDHASAVALVVTSPAEPVDTGWDLQQRERQRKVAAERAKAAAAALRNQAKAQADLAAFLVELRKRGRAQ